MRIIVDTNIVFSAIIKPTSKIAKILLNSGRHFQLYSCDFLKIELFNHRAKLVKLTGLTVLQVEEIENLVTEHITFINERLIPSNILLEAEKLVHDIDLDDIVFVALSNYLEAKLWSGDKKLITGLESRGYKNVIDTSKIFELLNTLET